jgi:hypothetical protein
VIPKILMGNAVTVEENAADPMTAATLALLSLQHEADGCEISSVNIHAVWNGASTNPERAWEATAYAALIP